MAILTELPVEETADWLHGESSPDLWNALEANERQSRAAEAQIDAVVEELCTRGWCQERSESVARDVYNQLSDAEFRELRGTALARQSDEEDYIETIAVVLADYIDSVCD